MRMSIMETELILVDPVFFDALHLSALANDGIGGWRTFRDGIPHCPRGHAIWLDGEDELDATWGSDTPLTIAFDLDSDGALPRRNDVAIKPSDVRFPFEQWLALLGVDVREAV